MNCILSRFLSTSPNYTHEAFYTITSHFINEQTSSVGENGCACKHKLQDAKSSKIRGKISLVYKHLKYCFPSKLLCERILLSRTISRAIN